MCVQIGKIRPTCLVMFRKHECNMQTTLGVERAPGLEPALCRDRIVETAMIPNLPHASLAIDLLCYWNSGLVKTSLRTPPKAWMLDSVDNACASSRTNSRARG